MNIQMDMDIFTVFSIIGTIAFAVSGAIVAMEEEYDILGVYVLGLVTAFGGGVIRNLLIGVPDSDDLDAGNAAEDSGHRYDDCIHPPGQMAEDVEESEAFFDAIGLSAFAIQGALYAAGKYPLSAVMVAAMLTGIGGGMIRDVLAGRKPLVLRDEIYAVWALAAGAVISLGWFHTPAQLLILFVIVIIFRMLSVHYSWRLPRRSLKYALAQSIFHADEEKRAAAASAIQEQEEVERKQND